MMMAPNLLNQLSKFKFDDFPSTYLSWINKRKIVCCHTLLNNSFFLLSVQISNPVYKIFSPGWVKENIDVITKEIRNGQYFKMIRMEKNSKLIWTQWVYSINDYLWRKDGWCLIWVYIFFLSRVERYSMDPYD